MSFFINFSQEKVWCIDQVFRNITLELAIHPQLLLSWEWYITLHRCFTLLMQWVVVVHLPCLLWHRTILEVSQGPVIIMVMEDHQPGKRAYLTSIKQEGLYRIEDLQQIQLLSYQEPRSSAPLPKEAQTQAWVEDTQTQAIIPMMMPYRMTR